MSPIQEDDVSETRWTKGPWEVCDDGPHKQYRVHFYDVDADDDGRAQDFGHDICDVTDVGNDAGEANAHLIAAAPALYEALDELVRIRDRKHAEGIYSGYDREKHAAWDSARAALAQASPSGSEETK